MITRLETGWRRDWPTGEYELYDEDGLLTERATDPLHVETFTYDASGRLVTRYDESGGAWTLSYDAGTGKLTGITDPSGRTTSVTIDSSGNLTSVVLPDASTIGFAYDTQHRLVTKTDPRGIAWHYAYGLHGSVESVQLGDGSSRQYRPKTTRNLLRHVPAGTGTEVTPAPRFAEPTGEVDRQGQTIALDLDPYGKRRQAIMPGNLNWTFTRDDWGEVTLAQGPATRQWQQTFDDARRLIRKRVATATAWRETRYTYPIGSEYPTMVKTVGSSGERTETRTYDSLNRVTSWTDALGRVYTQTWSGNGRVATITEPGGRTWSYTYDVARNRITTIDPAAQSTLETRNARGEVTRIETPAGRVTEFEYDVLGRIILVRSPDDTTVTSTWQTINDCPTCQGDELGLLLTTTDAAGRTTTTTYDALGRATAVDAPMELDSTTTYDLDGRVVESEGPGGLTSEYDWDGLGRLITDTAPGPNGPTSRDHSYDDLGRRTRTEEPAGVGTTWEYDMDSQVAALTVDSPHWSKTYYSYSQYGDFTGLLNPDLGAINFLRDDLGRVTRQWDATGREQLPVYDTAGDMTAVNASGGGAPAETATYTYDASGRRVSSTSAVTSVTATYDPDGTVLSRTATVPPIAHAYTHDVAGRLSRTSGPVDLQLFRGETGDLLGWMLGNEEALEMRFPDAAGRDWLIWNPPTLADAEAYMMLGIPPTGIADLPPLGRAVEYTYGSGRLLSHEVRQDGVILHTRSYTHAPDGRVASFADSLNGSWTYGYDDLGRLTSGVHTLGGQTTTVSYTYDTRSNRTSMTVDGATTTYTYNVGNRDGDRLLASTDAGGTTTYTFDAMGRPLTKTAPGSQVTTYTWDVWGRLRTVALPSGVTATYGYDTWGDRVAKHVTDGGVTTSTYYWRDDHLVYETDAAGVPLAVTGMDEDGTTPVWRQVDGDVYLYQLDHLGTPIFMTDLAGTVVWAAVYEPFGAAYELVSDVSQPWRFPGQYFDAETGLHYNRQRYYDPATGRYLNPDPIGQSGGLNTFNYAASSPPTSTDPNGLAVYKCTVPIVSSPYIPSWFWPNNHSYIVSSKHAPGGGSFRGWGLQPGSNLLGAISSLGDLLPEPPFGPSRDCEVVGREGDDDYEQCINDTLEILRTSGGISYSILVTECQELVNDILARCEIFRG